MANFTTYNPKSGKAGKTVVTISAEKNSTNANRADYIKFRQGNKSVILSVIQKMIEDYEFYCVSDVVRNTASEGTQFTTVYWYGADAGISKYTVTNNLNWVTVYPMESSSVTQTVRFDFKENTGSEREGYVKFDDGKKSFQLRVYQEAKAAPADYDFYITKDSSGDRITEIETNYQAQSVSFYVHWGGKAKHPSGWTSEITSNPDDFINMLQPKSSSDELTKITFTKRVNNEHAKSGTIKYTDGEKTLTLTIKTGEFELMWRPEELHFNREGGTETAELTNLVVNDYYTELGYKDAGCTFEPSEVKKGVNEYNITKGPNMNKSAYEGEIRTRVGDIYSNTIKVTQDAGYNFYLFSSWDNTYYEKSITLGYKVNQYENMGGVYLDLGTGLNYKWRIKQKPTWVQLYKSTLFTDINTYNTYSEYDAGPLYIATFQENDTGSTRTGKVVLSPVNKTDDLAVPESRDLVITVTQEFKQVNYPMPTNSQLFYSTTDKVPLEPFGGGDFNVPMSSAGYKDDVGAENGYYYINFSGTLTGMDTVAFRNKKRLSMLILPKSFISFGMNALEGCSNLKDIRLWGNTAPSVDDNIMKGAGVMDGVLHIRTDASTRNFQDFLNCLNNGGNRFTIRMDLDETASTQLNFEEQEIMSLEDDDNETSENG